MTRKWEFKQKGNAGIEKFNALWAASSNSPLLILLPTVSLGLVQFEKDIKRMRSSKQLKIASPDFKIMDSCSVVE